MSLILTEDNYKKAIKASCVSNIELLCTTLDGEGKPIVFPKGTFFVIEEINYLPYWKAFLLQLKEEIVSHYDVDSLTTKTTGRRAITVDARAVEILYATEFLRLLHSNHAGGV